MRVLSETMKKIINHLKENWIRHGFETLVVTIGIFSAFMLNNWNENRIEQNITTSLFQNLLVSLKQDSTNIDLIISHLEKSVNAQEYILTNNYSTFAASLNSDQSFQLLLELRNGVISFFPRFGVYNLIVDNNYLKIIKSNQLREDLIDHYDYKYRRYKDGLLTFIHKQFGDWLIPLLTKNLACDFEFEGNYDQQKLENGYLELQETCRAIHGVSYATLDFLKEIQSSNNKLIKQIESEFNK